MIDMYTARTEEVEDISAALEEIKSQIDLTKLKKNSCGLIFCHIDFIESGIVKAICDELPFTVIGMTSMANADEHGYSLFDMMLTVLTSDDVSFEAGMTKGINRKNYVNEIGGVYSSVRSRVNEDPNLIISFMPYIRDVAGYEVVEAMDEACHGIPIWGSITNNVDFNYEQVYTICNGDVVQAGLAMMFINGPIEPKFIVSSIPERNIASNRAIITKSEGANLSEINDMPILEYLSNIGLTIEKENITTTPLMVYYDNETEPVALGFYTLFEDGSVLTGGAMPIGTSVAVGSIDSQSILESLESGLEMIEQFQDRSVTLLLPCVTRYIMSAPDQEVELRMIKDRLGKSGKPFMMGYSGGEICPMLGADGKLHNRFHNYTFCALVL
jgi:hypothetical protein